jgi:MoxR-like ATPase
MEKKEFQIQNQACIDGIRISLREPDEFDTQWIENSDVFHLLVAAMLRLDNQDRPLTPVLTGAPGSGKTTLACAAARSFNLPIYIINCSIDTRPEDLIVTAVIGEDRKIIYRASPLVSAMICGGICILDEANRMPEKSWASLAPLLDDRHYVESIIAGVKITAHPDFRLVATMNEDSSTFNLPGYIDSRLKPVIPVEQLPDSKIIEIIKLNIPYARDELIQSIMNLLMDRKNKGISGPFSPRDAIKVTQYAMHLEKQNISDPLMKAINGIIPQSGIHYVR